MLFIICTFLQAIHSYIRPSVHNSELHSFQQEIHIWDNLNIDNTNWLKFCTNTNKTVVRVTIFIITHGLTQFVEIPTLLPTNSNKTQYNSLENSHLWYLFGLMQPKYTAGTKLEHLSVKVEQFSNEINYFEITDTEWNKFTPWVFQKEFNTQIFKSRLTTIWYNNRLTVLSFVWLLGETDDTNSFKHGQIMQLKTKILKIIRSNIWQLEILLDNSNQKGLDKDIQTQNLT